MTRKLDHTQNRRSIPAGDGSSNGGFSVVEIVGVLAILTILAAAVIPIGIRRIDIAAKAKEYYELSAMSNSLVLNVIRTKTFPSATAGLTNWARVVADWAQTTSNRVALNKRGLERVFLVDPSGWFNGRTLPAVQGSTGYSNAPSNARVIVLSSMKQSLTTALSSGMPTAAEFSALWDTADGQKPNNTTWNGWAGSGDELLIQRISFDHLFHRIVLVNRDPPGKARFAINSTNTVGITNVFSSYFLNGTDVGLYDSSTPPATQMRFLLTADKSLAFQGGQWGVTVIPGTYNELLAHEFADLARLFMNTEIYSGAHKGNQQGTVVAMFNFMLAFQLWADHCPHFYDYGVSSRNDWPEYLLMRDVAGGDGQAGLLNDFSGTGGLLK